MCVCVCEGWVASEKIERLKEEGIRRREGVREEGGGGRELEVRGKIELTH